MKSSPSLLFTTFYALGTTVVSGVNQDDKPNIILIVADDQGWGDMGYYGHPIIQTPNLDEMANAGIRFDRFYAAAPVSSPTRGSIMTGRHPNRFECFTWGHALRPQEVTIAERLQEAGYSTGHFGKWHLGTIYKESPVNPGNSGFHAWLSSPNFFENDPMMSREGEAVQLKGESSMVTVQSAVDFIEAHAGADPFFAYICFGSPHQPHIAKEHDRMSYLYLDDSFQQYYGELTGMDRAIGVLRNKLRQLGIDQNTIVWFVSDNGGLRDSSKDPDSGERRYLSSTGGRAYKGSIYEGGLRVPAIVEWPALITEPSVTHLPASTSDIYPTLLELIGFTGNISYPLDGVSLMPMIKGETGKREKPIAFWSYPEKGIPVSSEKIMMALKEMQEKGLEITDPALLLSDAGQIANHYGEEDLKGHAAWLEWPFKLHRIAGKENTVYELYNLEEDPWEEYDLSADETHVMESMSKSLLHWMRSVINSMNGKDYKKHKVESTPI